MEGRLKNPMCFLEAEETSQAQTWAHSLTFSSAHAARALDSGKQLEDSVREGQPPKHVLRQQDASQRSEIGVIQKV